MESLLLCLKNLSDIHQIPFILQDNIGSGTSTGMSDDKKYDIILFCHSMYSMKLKHRFIKQVLKMLIERPQGEMVAVFHHDRALHLDSLMCHQIASFPTGFISVADDDEVLNCFTSFITGFIMQDVNVDKTI